MKEILAGIVLMAVSLTVFAQKELVIDANAEMRSLQGSFNKIKISGAIDVYLSQAEAPGIAISAVDNKFKDDIKTVAEGNELNIYYAGEKNWGYKNRKLKVYVSFKNIDEISATGASGIYVAGTLNVPSLDLKLAGASNFKGKIVANTFNIHLSGASDVILSGEVKKLNIVSSGASDIAGYGLVTDSCNAIVSGASDVKITVNTALTANASGASNFFFKGSATSKDTHSSGASKISKKER